MDGFRFEAALVHLVHMSLVRESVHRQPAGALAFLAAVAREVPRLPRRVNDVAFLGLDSRSPSML